MRNISKHTASAIALGAGLLLGPAASAAACTLDGLAWMAGVWRTDDATTHSEERWTIAPGGRLMGSSWLLHTDKPGGLIEANTIQADGEHIALRLRHFSGTLLEAREEKTAPMVFLAADCQAKEVVFDDQGTQAGEHMTYRREGDTLVFIGDFIHQGQAIRVEIRMTRAGD